MKHSLVPTLVTLSLLGSCGTRVPGCVPEAHMADHWSTESLANRSIEWSDEDIQGDWWRLFNDPLLVELIDILVEENHEIRIAWTRVCQARMETAMVSSERMPKVNFDLNGKQSVPGGGIGGGGFMGGSNPFDVKQTQISGLFNASWEIDLFGRLQQQNRSARAAEEISIEDAHGIHVAIIADFVHAYFEYRAYEHLLVVAHQEATLLSDKKDLVLAKVKQGLGTASDVDTATIESHKAQEVIPDLEAQFYASLYHMAYLLGEDALALSDRLKSGTQQAKFPEKVTTGLPSELLRRRPDIRRAEAKIEQAAAEEGVAIADLFPRLTLNGGIGPELLKFNSLSWSGTAWSYGESLTAPIFDSGKRRANVQRARFVSTEAYLQYEQAVLKALEESDTALMRFTKAREQEASARTSAEAQTRSYEQVLAKQNKGIATRSQLIDANILKIREDKNLILKQINSLDTLIGLYKALGGGWESE